MLLPLKAWFAFNRATLDESRASGTAPLARLEALSAVSPAPLPMKLFPALFNVFAPLKVWFAFSWATLDESRASGTVPLRLLAGTLFKPAPLPLNVVAVTVPLKFGLLLSKATLGESRTSGIVPVILAAATAFALLA